MVPAGRRRDTIKRGIHGLGSFNGGSKTIEYPSLDANQEASFASSWQSYDQGRHFQS